MKRKSLIFLLTLLMSMVGTNAFALYEVASEYQGVMIYYQYIYKDYSSSVIGLMVVEGDNEYSGNVVIPEGVYTDKGYLYVRRIGYQAFRGCSGLTSVVIPNSVTSIGDGAFSGSSGLTSVTIGNGVTSIGESTFRYCNGLTLLTIGNSVTSIGDYAFEYCKGLTIVSIPNSVKSIGNYAFRYCNGLTLLTIGSSVTSIGDYAFESCKSLTIVSIPNSVKSIGQHAFQNCTQLTTATIGNSVTSIGQYAFSECSKLTSMVIPNSVTSIGQYAYNKCSGLTSLTIGNSVTNIGNYAFSECSNLTSMVIPNSVTSIGNWVYNKCSGLTSLTIGNSVMTIGYDAFAYCTGLTSVEIPNSVMSIGVGTFLACSGLKSVKIGNGMMAIGDGSFNGCGNLTEVTIDVPTPIIITSKTFSNRANATLYVPTGCTDAYLEAEYWKEFKFIKVIGEIDQIDMSSSDITINPISAVTYNGSPQTPAVAVMDNTYTLIIDTDYTVSYSDNTNAGTATVTITGMGNYTGTKTVNFTIDKAPLTVTAQSYTITQGDPLPTYELTYSGFVNNETSSVLTTQPTISCAATSDSAPGTYDITVSGGSASNYTFSYVNGTLTINEGTMGITTTNNGQLMMDNVYYDLNGRRVENPTQGLYIVNGKKVFVK